MQEFSQADSPVTSGRWGWVRVVSFDATTTPTIAFDNGVAHQLYGGDCFQAPDAQPYSTLTLTGLVRIQAGERGDPFPGSVSGGGSGIDGRGNQRVRICAPDAACYWGSLDLGFNRLVTSWGRPVGKPWRSAFQAWFSPTSGISEITIHRVTISRIGRLPVAGGGLQWAICSIAGGTTPAPGAEVWAAEGGFGPWNPTPGQLTSGRLSRSQAQVPVGAQGADPFARPMFSWAMPAPGTSEDPAFKPIVIEPGTLIGGPLRLKLGQPAYSFETGTPIVRGFGVAVACDWDVLNLPQQALTSYTDGSIVWEES